MSDVSGNSANGETPRRKDGLARQEDEDREQQLGANDKRDDERNAFDVTRLRLPNNFESMAGVRKKLITVPVRKPDRQTFVRTHPSPEYRLETAVLELKEEREMYLVDPSLWSELPGEIVRKVLITTVSRQGVVFLWPIPWPGPDGKILEWHRSQLEGAFLAEKRWVRLAANMGLGAYDIYEATGNLGEPAWPEVPFEELVRIAFRDRFVRTLEDPVVRRLRGES